MCGGGMSSPPGLISWRGGIIPERLPGSSAGAPTILKIFSGARLARALVREWNTTGGGITLPRSCVRLVSLSRVIIVANAVCGRAVGAQSKGADGYEIGAWFVDTSTGAVVDARASTVQGVFLALVDKLGIDLDDDYDQFRGLVFEAGEKLLSGADVGVVVDVADMGDEPVKIILRRV